MDLDPIPRNATISDVIFARLVDEILSGRWPAGEPVISERELAVAWQVNRHAVREALKRVQQAGLIRISHGGKTRVLDWRRHAGLDALSALATAGTIPANKAVTDVAVMRRAIAADAARLCATDATDEQRAAIAAAAASIPESADLAALGEATLRFWSAVIDGSDNVAYRLALNTLLASIEEVGSEVVHRFNAAELTDREAHVDLAAAITAGDADQAGRLARALLSRMVTACQSLVGGTRDTGAGQPER